MSTMQGRKKPCPECGWRGCDECGEHTFRLLVCGGRNYRDREHVYRVLDDLSPTTVIHGACPTGADKLADDWAKTRGVDRLQFPADWSTYGKSAGPRRNAKMIAEAGAHVVLAFPGGDGTADLMRRAKAAGIEVHLECLLG